MSDLIEELWASDAASALTNQAARKLEEQEKAIRAAIKLIQRDYEGSYGIGHNDLRASSTYQLLIDAITY